MVLGVGLGLYVLGWVAFWGLRSWLRLSLEIEEEELQELPANAKAQSKRCEKLEIIGVLKALDAIMLTVTAALMPIAGITLGGVMPKIVRDFLRPFVGPETLVPLAIGALFAYGAVFLILKGHEGWRVGEALRRFFRRGGERAGSGSLREPGTGRDCS